MPPPGPDGEVNIETAPDFLAVAGPTGIAGYAPKGDVLGAGDAPFLVYGDDLRTVVGQMVPNRGFVPVGVDPATVPTFAVEAGPSGVSTGARPTKVALYVRNEGPTEAWVSMQAGTQNWDSTGFATGNPGVGCYDMVPGSRLVLLDRSPSDPGSAVLKSIYTRGNEPEPPSLWISIAPDRSVQQGIGTPGWWGVPQTC
jgi:hypothetical protein